MGLNWSQGLAGAAEGLNIMAGRAARREEQEVEQMRQENLLRLRQKLDLETEGVRHKNALELSDKQYEKAEMLQKHADERAETRERGAFGRQKQLIEAQETRASNRETSQRESEARREDTRYREGLTSQRQKAIDDISRAKQKIAAYQKQTIGSALTGDAGAEGFGRLAQTDEFAASLLSDLKEADQRRRALDEQIGKFPLPRSFSEDNQGATRSQFLIPDAGP